MPVQRWASVTTSAAGAGATVAPNGVSEALPTAPAPTAPLDQPQTTPRAPPAAAASRRLAQRRTQTQCVENAFDHPLAERGEIRGIG